MIADFGLARSWTPAEEMPPHKANEYTNMVVTRWYRARGCFSATFTTVPRSTCGHSAACSERCTSAHRSSRAKAIAITFKIFAHCGPLNQDTFPGWMRCQVFRLEGHPWTGFI